MSLIHPTHLVEYYFLQSFQHYSTVLIPAVFCKSISKIMSHYTLSEIWLKLKLRKVQILTLDIYDESSEKLMSSISWYFHVNEKE